MLSNANVIVNAKESLASEADTMTFIRNGRSHDKPDERCSAGKLLRKCSECSDASSLGTCQIAAVYLHR